MTYDKERARKLILAWRTAYDTLTFDDHKKLYAQLIDCGVGEQAHFSFDAARAMLEWEGTHVLEIGGWDGQLAKRMLHEVPEIVDWTNFEVCDFAAESHEIEDDRYSYDVDRWAWDADLRQYDTFVSSHALEHMSRNHLELVVDAVSHMKQAYIQLPGKSKNITTYSTHVLGMDPNEVFNLFREDGWTRSMILPPMEDGDRIAAFKR